MQERDQRQLYVFGKWEVDLAHRELRAGGAPVPLGRRAFDVFEVLVQSCGKLITKDDLIGRVWPGAIVEENRLHVYISAVRKALGADRAMLKTAFGRGYRLVGDWSIQAETGPAAQLAREPASRRETCRSNLPAATAELIGRAPAIQRLQDLLLAYRMVTLTGPPGIGKSALALEVARSLSSTFRGDRWFVELA